MHHSFMWDVSRIVAQLLQTGERKVLIENGSDARYIPSGHIVFVRQGVLMAAPFNLERLELLGEPTVVLDDIMHSVDAGSSVLNSGAAQYCFSDSGLLVYAPGGIRPHIKRHIVWVDRNGGLESIAALEGGSAMPRLSPDGTRLAYVDYELKRSIWIYDLNRIRPPQRFILRGAAWWFTWTQDAKRLTFMWSESGTDKIYWQLADRSDAMERLTDNSEPWPPGSWSPGDKELAFVARRTKGTKIDFDIYLLLMPSREVRPLISSQFNEAYPVFSPDGRWLAYTSDETGRSEVYVQPFPGPGPVMPISSNGGAEPLWSPKGDELFYRQQNPPTLMAVSVRSASSELFGRPRELFDVSQFVPGGLHRNYDITHDGQRFLMVKLEPEQSQAVTEMTLVTNWFEELKRLCPPK
jgi:serine/threonine-protein kinase